MGAKHGGAFREDGIGGGDETGVPESREIFGGIEGEGGGVPECPGGGPAPRGTESLSGVFDEEEVAR